MYDASLKLQIVSKAGNGGGSASSPMSITFKFAVNYIISMGCDHSPYNHPIIASEDSSYNRAFVKMQTLSTSYTSSKVFLWLDGSTWYLNYAKRSSDYKTLYWYGGSSDKGCYNSSYTWYFIGIG